jgi:8-oxo-dGTP pyrophosphatase MutT (NUDIX family)
VLALVAPDADARPSLYFTVRRPDLPTHAGQISFPGGKVEPADSDEIAAALRETHEELGVVVAREHVLGLLDDVPTPSRFVITPVIAWVPTPLELRPDPREVAEVFHVPLDRLADPRIYSSAGQRQFLGIDFTMHEYAWEQHRIWGATAKMVASLLEVLL